MVLTEDQFTFVMTVLKHSEMTPDWKAVAVEVGITRADNATTKFRNILKSTGYGFTSNKIVELEAGDKDKAGAAAPAGSTPPTASATTTTPTGKKRKSPSKKAANGEGGKSKKTKVAEPACGEDKDATVELKKTAGGKTEENSEGAA